MFTWFKKNLYIFIVFIGLILAIQNYAPGTFLSGWDTLHPEFNFTVAFQREINGVFRSEQGLGAVAAHSHMADLPHAFILYLLHFISPLSNLRYFYIFLNLILGPVGMYFFLNKHVVKNKIGAFLGSIFYLLNLGTLQTFVVPFEMFTTQYALLPWIFLFATDYLFKKEKSRKSLLFFLLSILFGAPMAYAATLWYVFFFVLILYLFSLNLFDRSPSTLKKSLILIIMTLGINLFWILPNIYYALNHGQEVTKALINQLFSPQAFLYNKDFGNFKDILLLKNFLFDWNVYSGNNNFSQLLSPWISHLNQAPVMILGFIFAIIAFTGIFRGFLKREKVLVSLTLPLLLSLFFLINDNPPTGFIYNFLQNKIPLFKEALRFPGDKILGIFTFLYAIYFAKGQEFILKIFKKIRFVYLPIFLLLIIYYMLPAFQGNLISPYMRIQIPIYYFQMFDWFDSKPHDARIAELPVNSFWGWKYYSWYPSASQESPNEGSGQVAKPSFQGADFLQFGIPQPLLDRDFDRWSSYNEQYYREMSYAVYSNNPARFLSVLQKYNIRYIIFDTSILAPKDDPKVLFHTEILNLLNQKDLVQVKNFNNTLFVYEVRSQAPGELISNPVPVSSNQKTYYEDFIYQNYGNYINQKEGLGYPLADFINNLDRVNNDLLQFQPTGIRINMQTNQALTLPSLTDTESYIDAQLLIEKNNNKFTINIFPVLPFKTSLLPSIPVTFDVSPGEIIASVNQRNNFVLNPAENIPLSIGTAQLNTTKPNSVAIYSLSSKKTRFSNLSGINYSLSYCNEAKSREIFGIQQGININSFYIFGKNNPVCMYIPLSQFLGQINSQEALVGLNFDYKSFIPAQLCLAKNNECVSQLLKDTQSNYAAINKQNAGDLAIKLSVNTDSKTQVEQALIENFSIDILNPVARIDIPENDIKDAVGDTVVENVRNPAFVIPFSGEKKLSGQTILSDENQTYTTDTTSDLNNKRIVKDNKGDYIRYMTTKGTMSDNFIYQNLPQDRAYLVAVTSRNVKGLPLTLCMANEVTKHCDIYTTVSSSKNFVRDVFLLPAQLTGKSGFSLNISNLGIGNESAINDLSSVEIIPFPYRYLSQIFANNTKTTYGKVFVLPKSYESGWKTYEVKDSNFFTRNFPFLFGKELKNHVLVNNWANGWIMPSSESDVQSSKFITIFWPQYLEYLGFVTLILIFIIILLMRNSNRPSRTSVSSAKHPVL
jgi:hypothetical protein